MRFEAKYHIFVSDNDSVCTDTRKNLNMVEGWKGMRGPTCFSEEDILGLGHQVCDFQEKYLQKVTVKCFLTLKVSMAYLEY